MKDNITFISADDDQSVRCIICGARKTTPIRQFPLIVCDKCRAAIMKIRETTDLENTLPLRRHNDGNINYSHTYIVSNSGVAERSDYEVWI